jgi:Zn-dependent protease with chaperone function
MQRLALALLLLVPSLAPAAEPREEKADGYLEWRQGDVLIADGQRIRATSATKLKIKAEARNLASLPLGCELKAKGVRDAKGVLVARELEAKPNGSALFESDVKAATDEAERRSVAAGRFLESEDPRAKSVGRLRTDGPEVARVRRVVENLCPPYLEPPSFRVYVIDNKEWNAFAMGNYSIYVFSGLLRDLDDDEVAIVLGHEMVHATHEHTRRQFKKQMWIQLAALGLAGVEEASIDDDRARQVAQLVTLFSASAVANGYGRDLEDQADRVGLRYAYEGGYDIRKGPRLWNRFAQKYGEEGKVVNFFFADHSLSSARAVKLERQIALNYPEGPKTALRSR